MIFKRILLTGILVLLLAGCSSTNNNAEDNPPLALSLLIGNHQNSRGLNLNSPLIVDKVSETIENYGFISVVSIDSKPSVIIADSFDIPEQYKNADPVKLKSDAKNKAINLLKLLQEIKADDPEVDALESLRLAVRTLASAPEGSLKTIVVIDTGLNTSGLINFRNNLLYANPEDIAQMLSEKKAIPNLNGIKVIWQQLGDTCAPQQELSSTQRISLENIWRAIIEKGGGVFECSLIIPSNSVIKERLPEVSVVNLPEEEPVKFDDAALNFNNPVIFTEEHIKFIGDSHEYIEPEKAMKSLIPVKKYILAKPDTQLLLIGTTAGDEDTDFTRKLSLDRANAVKNSLIELGVSEKKLIAMGMGVSNPWHFKGVPLNSPLSAQNRKVVMIDVNSKMAREILQKNKN